MAFAIICLATNQKFNFSKYIFDNMVKHLDGRVKFMMYPRFVQVFLDNQVECMDRHNAILVISSHTKKVFANMKRERKGFSGVVTPLFETMMVQAPKDMGEGSEIPTFPHHTPIVTQPSSSQPQKKQNTKRKQRKETKAHSLSSEIPNEESVPTASNDPLPSGEDRMQLTELMILCTNLQKQVLDLEKAKTAQAVEIFSLKKRVKKQERKKKRLNEEEMFGVNDLDSDEMIVDATTSENAEQSTKVAKKEVSTVDPVTTAGETMEERFKKTQAEVTEGSSKRAGDELDHENAKRQRLEEENESAELKRYLEIVPEDDDDVKIKAIPLSSKSPTVDYEVKMAYDLLRLIRKQINEGYVPE
nr:hypothetical protein [Tanacetum cinerariifolium]